MTRICPGCGTETVPDARFCRKCGAPLRATGQHGDSETISPQAATIPLRDEGRTTDGLSPEDPRAGAHETSRVSRADMDSILQQAARSAEFDPNKTIAQTPTQETMADAERNAATQSGTLPPTQSAPSPPTPPRPSSQPLSEEDLMKTRPAMNDDFDEELTVTVPRPFTGDVKPVQVQHVPTTGPLGGGAQAAGQSAQATPTGQQTQAKRKKGPWVIVAVVCVVLLAFAAVGAWLAVTYLRRPATDVSTVEPTAPATADDRTLAQEKLIEAESLLATGDLSGALERLREAVRLDPANSRAHRRLGDILLETGARREAIEELRMVTQLEPNDFTAWRALASAQMAEGLPADAVESYKRLVALTGETDPNDVLSYADALRLAGRTEEARALYQKLSTAPVADVAAQARRHLAELASALSTPTPQPTRDTGTQTDESDASQQTADATAPTPQATPTQAPTPQPTPQVAQAQLSPDERYRRGVSLWGSNRSAAVTEFLAAARAGNADAHYYLGLNLVEGKDMRSLKRAEVVAALRYFQNAQSSSHGSRARQYVQQLEKEFDRIRSQQ